MEAALVGLVLWLLVKGGPVPVQQQQQPDPGPAPRGEPEGRGSGIGEFIGAGVGALAPPLIGLLGGGGAAAGGTAALGTGGVAGGGAAGGTGLTASTTVVSGSGPTGSIIAGSTTAGVSAGSSGGFAILTVVVLFVIGSLINKQQVYAKSFQSKLGECDPNARSMHSFEVAMFKKLAPGLQFSERQVRDWRLDKKVPSEGVVFQGFRTVLSWIPLPAGGENETPNPRRMRAMAYIMLRESARRVAVLRARWPGVLTGRKAFSEDYWRDCLGRLFTSGAMVDGKQTDVPLGGQYPNLGGLDRVPLLTGQTQAQRGDPSEVYPPEAQLRASDATSGVLLDEPSLKPGDRLYALLAGFLQVANVWKFDPEPYLYLDVLGFRREHRDRFVHRMDLRDDEVEYGTTGAGAETRYWVDLKPEVWGMRVRIDPAALNEAIGGDAGTYGVTTNAAGQAEFVATGAVPWRAVVNKDGSPIASDVPKIAQAIANERSRV